MIPHHAAQDLAELDYTIRSSLSLVVRTCRAMDSQDLCCCAVHSVAGLAIRIAHCICTCPRLQQDTSVGSDSNQHDTSFQDSFPYSCLGHEDQAFAIAQCSSSRLHPWWCTALWDPSEDLQPHNGYVGRHLCAFWDPIHGLLKPCAHIRP